MTFTTIYLIGAALVFLVGFVLLAIAFSTMKRIGNDAIDDAVTSTTLLLGVSALWPVLLALVVVGIIAELMLKLSRIIGNHPHKVDDERQYSERNIDDEELR